MVIAQNLHCYWTLFRWPAYKFFMHNTVSDRTSRIRNITWRKYVRQLVIDGCMQIMCNIQLVIHYDRYNITTTTTTTNLVAHDNIHYDFDSVHMFFLLLFAYESV